MELAAARYDSGKVTAVLEDIRCGMSLLRSLPKQGVSVTDWYLWLNDRSEGSAPVTDDFALKYSRACQERVENWAEQIVDISDSREADIIIDERGRPVIAHDVINRDRLRVDTRKWLMSRMNPRKWGDKVQVGGDEDNPLKIALQQAAGSLEDKLAKLEKDSG